MATLVDVKIEKKIILELNKEEAEFLKNITQNPLAEQESHKEECIRRSIWEVLDDSLKD